jgi:hypothetical protein
MQQGWDAWGTSWAWSAVLIAATVAIHATGVVLLAESIRRIRQDGKRVAFLRTTSGAISLIVGVALSLAFLFVVESMLWAAVYLWIGALRTPAEAALYSVGSMTTRGVSGLALEARWAMMGAVEAGNGILLFGMSTAFLFSVMQWLWLRDPALDR